VLEGKASLPEMPVGEDEFVELDEEGNPKKRAAGARRRASRARGHKKPPPAASSGNGRAERRCRRRSRARRGRVDDVDAADTPPAETRPASAPRRRPVGRSSAPRRGA